MKHKTITKFFALLLCLAMLMAFVPTTVFAEENGTNISMVEGDVTAEFVPAGTSCVSSDPSVAWVDEKGALNALKQGTATITAGDTEYTVTVDDYTDGSDVVGNLKILARYNDSMQFYDGHVYLLFTSYQDGVEIKVPDLYAGYEISDSYYKDISEDISNGSNHTGKDADKYFSVKEGMDSVTLNRGEIVTIGMYRDFDMTVPQAAIGSIKNSSAWKTLSDECKKAVIDTVVGALRSGTISVDTLIDRIKAAVGDSLSDYTKLIDGVVDGGLCFNRELYNQKLEWDQYENVTYELDITRKQLATMTMYLGGNLNKFSILKNSCATVAVRAWNAACGVRDGVDTAYKLDAVGEGIFALVDAPKSIRDGIKTRLPGYYLNNSAGVAEPDAGYQDETGWVYVSAPEKVTPLTYSYADDSIKLDEDKTKTAAMFNAAKGDAVISYNKDAQNVEIAVENETSGSVTTISGVSFTVNGTTVKADSQTELSDGVWFSAKVDNPVEGEDYYVTDADGKALASEYEDGYVSFFAESLPVSFKIIAGSEGAQNILKSTVVNGDMAVTEIYVKDGQENKALDSVSEVASGTKVYVKRSIPMVEVDYGDDSDVDNDVDNDIDGDFDEDYFEDTPTPEIVFGDITLNGTSILSSENYDEEEDAYFFTMPKKYSKLKVNYEDAEMSQKGSFVDQVLVGDILDADDYAELLVNGEKAQFDDIMWRPYEESEYFELIDSKHLKITGECPSLSLDVCSVSNGNLAISVSLECYTSYDNMVKVTYDEELYGFAVIAKHPDDVEVIVDEVTGEQETIENEKGVIFSGYRVKKGSELVIELFNDEQALLYIKANGREIAPGEKIIANEDTDIEIAFAEITVKGMPESIELRAEDDTYQLNAEVKYKGEYENKPVYDGSISYECYDDTVNVDENGLVSIVGDIPEGGKVVVITAYADSNSSICAQTKVIVGEKKESKVVGKLTIHARPINKNELVAHGAVTFTTYEDIDLDASFYHYYKPNDKYNELMKDYEENPGKYSSDPAICNSNELGLEDRESYFDEIVGGAGAEPQTISLKAGESITISNYSYAADNFTTVYASLAGGLIASTPEGQELLRQMQIMAQGGEIDSVKTFDSLVSTLLQMYMYNKSMGINAADGHSEGGLDINREMYNQFRRDDSQMPNSYYSVEITSDELAYFRSYLSNPENNYYSLFGKNCATGAVDIWNTTLTDRPELRLNGGYTGIAADPESLYIELTLRKLRIFLDGESGSNFYPRTVAYSDAVKAAINGITEIGKVAYTDECKALIDGARAAYEAVPDSQKNRVWNLSQLKAAESEYKKLQKNAEPEATEPTQPETQPETQPTEPAGSGKTDISSWKVTGIKTKTYTGKALKQSKILVSKGGEYADISVKYKNNVYAGKATVIITGKGNYSGKITKTFTIKKANNKMVVKPVAKSVKYATVKKKSVKVTALKVTKNQGALKFKKVKSSKKFTVNSKTGKITVKKGVKKGTYKFKVKVTAKGSKNYKSRSKTVTVKIKVK